MKKTHVSLTTICRVLGSDFEKALIDRMKQEWGQNGMSLKTAVALCTIKADVIRDQQKDLIR